MHPACVRSGRSLSGSTGQNRHSSMIRRVAKFRVHVKGSADDYAHRSHRRVVENLADAIANAADAGLPYCRAGNMTLAAPRMLSSCSRMDATSSYSASMGRPPPDHYFARRLAGSGLDWPMSHCRCTDIDADVRGCRRTGSSLPAPDASRSAPARRPGRKLANEPAPDVSRKGIPISHSGHDRSFHSGASCPGHRPPQWCHWHGWVFARHDQSRGRRAKPWRNP